MHNPTRTTLPALIALGQQASALQLHATHIRSRQGGQYLSRIKGRGMEFDESRPYQAGDDVRNIDWRVTARTDETYTKLFREERERPVILSIDNRQAMSFATQGKFKSVIAAELATLLAWAAHQQGDRVGAEIFTETGHQEFRPRRGQKNVLRLLKALTSQATDTGPGEQDLQAACHRLNRIVHPGSLVCIISDFRGLDERVYRELRRLARHSQILLFHVYDALESDLPPRGHYDVSFANRLFHINTSDQAFRERYQARYTSRIGLLNRLCHGHGIRMISCQTNESPFDVLRQHIGRRQTGKTR